MPHNDQPVLLGARAERLTAERADGREGQRKEKLKSHRCDAECLAQNPVVDEAAVVKIRLPPVIKGLELVQVGLEVGVMATSVQRIKAFLSFAVFDV